jgi:RNA polymerase primary sigma factor
LFEDIMTEVKKPRRRRAAPAGIAPNEPERDILDQYLYEVSTYPLLKGTEEIELAKKIRAGDQDSLQELVKRNLRFVISVAKKYQNRGLPLIDLIGEGNVGLLTAARKFDPDQGVKFISYAVWWIRQAILSALANQGRSVRVPLNRASDLAKIFRERERLKQELRRDPSPVELSEATGLSPEIVESLQTLNAAEIRLDAPIGDSDDSQLMDRFIADEAIVTEDEVEERLLSERVERALDTLQPRDAKVLKLYFGLEGGREHTLEEIGDILGVTRERIRQLRDRALKRLREGEMGEALASFAAA